MKRRYECDQAKESDMSLVTKHYYISKLGEVYGQCLKNVFAGCGLSFFCLHLPSEGNKSDLTKQSWMAQTACKN